VSLTRPYLILANTGAGYTGSEDNFSAFGLEPLTSMGRGESRGAELSVQKKLSDLRFYGIFSLTIVRQNLLRLIILRDQVLTIRDG
jgi:hypothetical protein